jgi:hypothetical protein
MAVQPLHRWYPTQSRELGPRIGHARGSGILMQAFVGPLALKARGGP